MSEIDPFDDIDKIMEYVVDNMEFENKLQIKQFILEFEERLMDLLDPDYEPSDSSESDDNLENKRTILITKDSEDFYEIVETSLEK